MCMGVNPPPPGHELGTAGWPDPLPAPRRLRERGAERAAEPRSRASCRRAGIGSSRKAHLPGSGRTLGRSPLLGRLCRQPPGWLVGAVGARGSATVSLPTQRPQEATWVRVQPAALGGTRAWEALGVRAASLSCRRTLPPGPGAGARAALTMGTWISRGRGPTRARPGPWVAVILLPNAQQ